MVTAIAMEENSEFCATVGPVVRTASLLHRLVTWLFYFVPALFPRDVTKNGAICQTELDGGLCFTARCSTRVNTVQLMLSVDLCWEKCAWIRPVRSVPKPV